MNKIFLIIKDDLGEFSIVLKAFEDEDKAKEYLDYLINTEFNIRYLRNNYCSKCNNPSKNCPYFKTENQLECKNKEIANHKNMEFKMVEMEVE